MKISWLRRVFYAESPLTRFTLCLYPELDKQQQLGGEFANTLMQSIHNPFWHDVLKHFKKLSIQCIPTDVSEFNAECIFYNRNIVIGKHTVYFKDWTERGIFQVCHLLNENGSLLNFVDFQIKFPTLKVNFFEICRTGQIYTTVDCQLKWFQLRLIYRALSTNRYLFLRKIVVRFVTMRKKQLII
ncbi:uncharacterized protein [Littorina saxatilis]|uniref:uncharacterized protein n=1 Tax=Littorina saxatilis TaxID=31220 RepID=UPI0038B4F71F